MDDTTLPGMPEGIDAPALDPDPQPGKRGRGRPRKSTAAPAAATRRTSTPRAPRQPTAAATVRAIRDEIEVYLLMVAGAGAMRCAPCGAVAEEQVPKVADKLAAIIARNPALVAKFSTGTLLADIFGLMMAVLPVAKAVAAHHGPGAGAHSHDGEVSADAAYDRYGPYAPAGVMG